MTLRYTIEPRDISPEKAARRMGLDHGRFLELLPQLLSRGFPAPDISTGNFDLDAIDEWRRARHRPLPGAAQAAQSTGLASKRLAAMRDGAR